MNWNNTEATEKTTEPAGIKFSDKVEIYEFLSRHIKQPIIITGSTALQVYGLVTDSDIHDLDRIIHRPTEETEKFFNFLSHFFPEHGFEKTYMKPDAGDTEIGKLSMFRLSGVDKDFKVHIFYKNKPQQTVLYTFKEKSYPLALPSDIFVAKRRFSRAKDYKQLAAICSKILGA